MALKSLELQLLQGSALEGCFCFILVLPSCKRQCGSQKAGLCGLCLQRSYNTSCFPWHDTAWQNKVFILCTCQLHSTGSEMMKYYRICCCLFPLGTCADLFKVSSAPSKCFIYYSWHLKCLKEMYQGIMQILFSLFAVVYLCPNINVVPNDKLCFLRVPPVCVCVELLWWSFWRRAPLPSEKCILTPDGVSLTVNYHGESLMSSCLRNFVGPLLKLFPITCSDA